MEIGFGGKFIDHDGAETRIIFYRRHSVKDLGSVVEFYTENGEKYRYVSPFKNSGDPSGYLPHRYYKSSTIIDNRGNVSERWDSCCACWAYFE